MGRVPCCTSSLEISSARVSTEGSLGRLTGENRSPPFRLKPSEQNGARLRKNHWILGSVVLAALVALVVWGRHRIHFDFGVFRSQLALVDWRKIGVGIGCIYFAYVFRAVRWSMLLRHIKHVGPLSLLGTQVIGFTAVALLGRVADPVRPYLVSRKTGLAVSNQIAVYIVERLFDAGSMGLVFSVAMLWVPSGEIVRATAHSGMLATLTAHGPGLGLFFVRYGGLVLTLVGATFLLAVRLAGEALAAMASRCFGIFSRKLGEAIAAKIRSFHSGLDIMRSWSDFAAAAGLSLGMWLLIAFSYFETCKAFTASPALIGVTPPKCVLLMVASGGASILQLPVIGWFSQIGLVAVAIAGVLGAPTEPATACAAMLLAVTFLAIVPVGLVWAQFEHVSLRKLTEESEHATHEGEGPIAAPEPGLESK
jgi:glycosyltransferase 2 family protein